MFCNKGFRMKPFKSFVVLQYKIKKKNKKNIFVQLTEGQITNVDVIFPGQQGGLLTFSVH